MSKDPFTQRNYPSESRGPGIITVVSVAIAIAVVSYFAYEYWWSCTDFGFFKFCSAVRKP